jgi:hypothetical protein
MGYYYKPGFPVFYEEMVKPYLNELIIKEIELLTPDYIVFFTGPKYDTVLNDVFNYPAIDKIRNFDERELCEIKISGVRKCFRTYHPNYLNRTGIKEKILNKILNLINTDIINSGIQTNGI